MPPTVMQPQPIGQPMRIAASNRLSNKLCARTATSVEVSHLAIAEGSTLLAKIECAPAEANEYRIKAQRHQTR